MTDLFTAWSNFCPSFILHHSGVQLILAYSWARPAILVAGKGRGGMGECFYFFFFFTFIPVLLLSLSLSFISTVSFLPFSGRWHNVTHKGWHVIKPQHNQSLVLVQPWGWSGGAMVSCILCHRGAQLILAYSLARPAILVAGKGRGGMVLFLLFLHFHSCSSFFPVPLFHLFDYLFYHSSPFLWETTQNDPQGLTCR